MINRAYNKVCEIFKPKQPSMVEVLAKNCHCEEAVVRDSILDYKGARSMYQHTMLQEIDARVKVDGKYDDKKVQELVDEVNTHCATLKKS
jgi:hypothetical protein